MDVLIVEDCPTDGPLVARLVEKLGHRVRLAKSAHEALPIVSQEPPHIVITDMMMPGLSGAEFVTQLRQMELPHYLYIIMRTGKESEQTISSAFSAGVDDFIAKSRPIDELRARVRAGERIVRLETKLRARVGELESALRRLDMNAYLAATAAAATATLHPGAVEPSGAATEGIAATVPWRTLDTVLQTVFAQFLQQEVATSSAAGVRLVDAVATTIPLTDVVHGVELGLTVMAERASLRAIAEQLFGEADEETALDLLSELANLSMGSTKNGFSGINQIFTGGLPKRATQADETVLLKPYSTHQRLLFKVGTSSLMVLVGARTQGNIKLSAAMLREGMVVAEDVHTAAGALLIRAGTRLTESLCERLARQLPRTQVIELSDPDAASAAVAAA